VVAIADNSVMSPAELSQVLPVDADETMSIFSIEITDEDGERIRTAAPRSVSSHRGGR
jgi:hypothetical protein